MDNLEELIKMLESPKTSARLQACEWLRVAPSTTPQSPLWRERRMIRIPESETPLSERQPLLACAAAPLSAQPPHPETKTCPFCADDQVLCGRLPLLRQATRH